MHHNLSGKRRACAPRNARALRRALRLSALTLGFAAMMARASVVHAQDAGDVGKDVKPDHWAYQAIQDLAAKGLIKGYPPDGKFLGGRTLTRYELATIIQRVVAKMDDLLKGAGGGGASKEDLDKLNASVGEIRELVNSFKTELTVIGTNMDQVKSDLAALKGQVDDLTSKVNGFDERISGLSKKVDEADILIDQALENLNEFKTVTNAALAKKVDVATGKLRLSGLLQVWGGTAFGDSLGGNFPSNFSAVPPGRNFGGGVGDTFRIRRGELAFIGSINSKVDYRAMFDIAKTGAAATGSSVNNAVLQDLWVGYQLTPRIRFEIGQQKVGLSEEGTRSSSQLLTVERSIMNTLPRTVGVVGDVRDNGAVAKYASALGSIALGIWNDNGPAQNGVDTDRSKFFSYVAYFTGIRHLTLGAWGGFNVGDTRPSPVRERAGVTAIWQSGPHYLEGEGAYTRDYAAGAPGAGLTGTIGLGGYVLYAHSISSQWQVVGRYDIWNPAYQGGTPAGSTATTVTGVVIPRDAHNLREYTIGFNYYIAKHNAKIQVNYIWEDPQVNAVGFFGKPRRILLANYQIAF